MHPDARAPATHFMLWSQPVMLNMISEAKGHSARRHVVGGMLTPYRRRKQTVSSSTIRDHDSGDYCDGNWTRNHQGIGNELIQPLGRVDGQGRNAAAFGCVA